jgi:hypothetical protein
VNASDRRARGRSFGGGAAPADQRTAAQLNRIAKALLRAGYREAGEMVALAALSVKIVLRSKARRRQRLRKSYQQAVAASDPAQQGAIVVSLPQRRRTARRSS